MLPLFRFLPVGGVFLAILILILALKAPGERALPPVSLTASGMPTNGNEDPQWRQVAIQAALQRANELTRLRDLPDTPPRSEPPVTEPQSVVQETAPAAEPAKVAALPAERLDADPDPDSITSSIDDAPAATIPVEIGAASSFELPVVLPEERPAIIRTPERTKPAHESRRKKRSRVAKPKALTPPPVQRAPQVGLLEELFSRRPNTGAAASTILNQTPAHRADAAY
ncbi:hypothetical protein MXD81_04455 [Microbacteriaceae bacterium K1510]|nr:hypothetical protein [Microbacteriaceae bacterium K1510]